jgi:hypothetical protein
MASLELKGRYYDGDTRNTPRVMNVEFIQCKDIGDTPTNTAVNGLKKGMSDLYGMCSWMDGWELTVYQAPDWHPNCDDNNSFVDSCRSFLNSVDEHETLAYHFFHKCGDSWRDYDADVESAWYDRTISSIDDLNWWSLPNRTFQVRTLHEVLHMFIDKDVPGVTDYMDTSYSKPEHTLGTAKYSTYWDGYVPTVMSDIYPNLAEEGSCAGSSNSADDKSDFLYSQCSLDALKETSDWCYNNCSQW